MIVNFVFYTALTTLGVIQTSAKSDYCSVKCGTVTSIGCNNNFRLGDNCPYGGALYQFNKTEKDVIVDDHNQYRNLVASGSVRGLNSEKLKTASRMALMTWSEDLAELACYNAKLCKFAHDVCRNTAEYQFAGQNIALSGRSDKHPDVLPAVRNQINLFFNEHVNTSVHDLRKFPLKKLKKIGHFTAMVNDRAVQIGCCGSKFEDSQFKWFYTVCNYAMTNIIDHAAYKTGKPCSDCLSGCDNKFTSLCSVNEPIDPNAIY